MSTPNQRQPTELLEWGYVLTSELCRYAGEREVYPALVGLIITTQSYSWSSRYSGAVVESFDWYGRDCILVPRNCFHRGAVIWVLDIRVFRRCWYLDRCACIYFRGPDRAELPI